MMQEVYKWHEDPGHAWLEVDKAELEELGIADKITPFSYLDNGVAYLEEDQDAGTFIKAKLGLDPDCWDKETVMKMVEWDKEYTMRSYRDSTPIRNYNHYE